MLIRFTPEQVTKFWPAIEPGIAMALPPGISNNPEAMNNVLASILVGSSDCWMSYERNADGNAVVNGTVITQITKDESGTRNLLLYAVYGIGIANVAQWREGYEVLKKWAIANGCANIVAYTEVPELCNIVTRLGGNANWRYAILPVA